MNDQETTVGEERSVALVTGGTRGIGRAIVEKLFHEGYSVVFTYNSNPTLSQEIVASLQAVAKPGQQIEGVKLNVSDSVETQSVLEALVKSQGRIDVLVNNAGVTKDGLLMRMSEADWDLVVDTNLKGVYNVTKAAIRPMMSQKRGRIISITSVVGISGNAGQANYCASKAGVIGFTKAIAKEVASRGITVNAVAPGYIETDMTGKLSDAQKEAMMSIIPLKRAGTAEDVANSVFFLASPAGAYITGQILVVDGGMTM
jgi:3-oxoacyl-[acyl-carrier protein] reductase